MKRSLRNYFTSKYNYNDMLQYFGTLLIVISNMAGSNNLSMVAKREICVFVLLSQGTKFVIDWLRLFDKLSFYVTLILRTLADILYFMVILLSILIYFGLAVYMLQLNADDGKENQIVASIFDNVLIDATLQ